MDADKKAEIQAHARAIAALLYEETDPDQVKTLAGIEAAVRGHLLGVHPTFVMRTITQMSTPVWQGILRSCLNSSLTRLRCTHLLEHVSPEIGDFYPNK